jgi:hypothetical protein
VVGSTINIKGSIQHAGFAVGGSPDLVGKTTEKVIEGLATPQDIGAYIREHHDILTLKNKYIGAWVQDDKTYLDVSEVHDDRRGAVALAKERNEIAVYDLKGGTSLYTMSDHQRPSDSVGSFVPDGDPEESLHEAVRDERITKFVFGKDQSPEDIHAALKAEWDRQHVA